MPIPGPAPVPILVPIPIPHPYSHPRSRRSAFCRRSSRRAPGEAVPAPPVSPLLVGAAAVAAGSCSRGAGGLAVPACPAPPPWVRVPVPVPPLPLCAPRAARPVRGRHGLPAQPAHRGRGGHRHPGQLGLPLPAQVR